MTFTMRKRGHCDNWIQENAGWEHELRWPHISALSVCTKVSAVMDKSRLPEHPAFRRFAIVALEEFAFLEKLGFRVASCAVAGNECAIRLTNDTTGIEMRYDIPNMPSVSLARLDKSGRFTRDHYGVKFLMCERCPDRDLQGILSRTSAEDSFGELLQEYAFVVRNHAADVLKGDFSIFGQLERRARKEIRRLQGKRN